MAQNTRNYQQIEQDRVEMNKLALAGVPQAEIATRFGVSQPQVAYDLRVVRQRWKETASMNIEAARERELALLDRIEGEAWDGLGRAELRGDGGEVRFAAILLKTSEQRANLLGLFENPPIPKPSGAACGLDQHEFERIRKLWKAKLLSEALQERGLPAEPENERTLPPFSGPPVKPAQA